MKLAEDLWTLDSDAGPALAPGQVVTFHFSCTNAGSATAHGVRIALPLPAQLVALPSEDAFASDGELVLDLAPRETKAVSRAARVAACRDGTPLEVQACAAIGAGTPAGSNVLRFTVCARPTLRFEPPVVQANEDDENAARVCLAVLNEGAGPAHDLRLTFPAPPASTGEDRSWTLDRLEPGERWSVAHDLAFDAERWSGAVELAGVRASASDAETTVLPPTAYPGATAPRLRVPGCRLAARGGPAAFADSDVRFEVILSNQGYGDARDVSVAIEAPGFAWLASDGTPGTSGGLTLAVGTLPPGSRRRLPVTARVPAQLADGSALQITATLRSAAGTLALEPLLYRARSAPVLQCTGWFAPEEAAAQPGAPLRVRLRIGNCGSDAAGAVVIHLRLPDGVVPAQSDDPDEAGILAVPFGTIAPGSHGERVVLLALAPEQIPRHLRFSGTLEAGGLTPLVLPAALLHVETREEIEPPVIEHDRPAGTVPGDAFTYTLRLCNAGSAAAGALTVSLSTGAAASYVSGTTRINGVPLIDDGDNGIFAARGLTVHGLAPGARLEVSWNVYVQRPSAEASAVVVSGTLTTSSGRRVAFAATSVPIHTAPALGARHPALGLMLDAAVRESEEIGRATREPANLEPAAAAPARDSHDTLPSSPPCVRLEMTVDVEARAWLRFLAQTRESTLVSHVVALRLLVPDRLTLGAEPFEGDMLLEPLRSIADRLSIKRRIPEYELLERDFEDPSARRAALGLARLAQEHGVALTGGCDLEGSALGSVAALRFRAMLQPLLRGANDRLSAALEAYRCELLAELQQLPSDDSFVAHAERAETRALESTRAALVAALEASASDMPRRPNKRNDAA